MRIYLAAPVFTQVQRAWNRKLADAIKDAFEEATLILPQDFRTEGTYNNPKNYGVLFRQCTAQIQRCDVLLAVLDGSDVDSGTAFSIGMAHALGKTVIGIRTDYRPGADHGVNLMCSRACRYLIREFSFQEDPTVVTHAVIRRLRKISPRKKETNG